MSKISATKCFSCHADLDNEQLDVTYTCKYCGTLQFIENQSYRCPDDGSGLEELATGREDKLYNVAVGIVTVEKIASTSFLQRHLRIGYRRASELLDALVADGFCIDRRKEYSG